MKFGMKERLLLRAKFHPNRCHDKGIGPLKLKFLLRFDQNVEYKRTIGACPLRDFHKICRVCTLFRDALAAKMLLDLLKGLWSYEGFNFYVDRVWLSPYFQRSLVAKLCVRAGKFFEVQERARGPLSPCQVWWGSDFNRRQGGQNR